MNTETISIFQLTDALRKQGNVLLLESQLTGHPESRQSFLAGKPELSLQIRDGRALLSDPNGDRHLEGDPLDLLEEHILSRKDWAFGYLGYDLKNQTEKLFSRNEDLIGAPDLYFFVPSVLIRFEGHTAEWIKGSPDQLSVDAERQGRAGIQLRQRISRQDYLEQVQQVQKDIYEGKYYELNLSHPLIYDLDGDPLDLYQQMKDKGPVPFAAYLKMGDIHAASASPERFLKKEGEKVISQPIKGTAPRDKEHDPIQKRDLQNSEKERAENLMIVDLVRNDMNRIARTGTVGVKDLFEIQSFETVHQMVSTVYCECREDVGTAEIIRACFPMGSMTGAPKIASMKAIEKYEQYRRGIYSGAIGYIRPNGDFDFNVVIRTAIMKGRKLLYPVGGAITSDSDPEREWEETLHKSRALTTAN